VIGARRRRQGTGPYLARHFHRAGARVVAIAGTSEGTVEQARRDLADDDIDAVGYTDVRRMLERETPEVLVIASPAERHDEHLEWAIQASCHVFCEKPFVWGMADPGRTARARVEAFQARARHCRVAVQWPMTLPAYDALHPGVLGQEPADFAMRLTPASSGPAMVPDALPHALSLLQAVHPDGDLRQDGLEVAVEDQGRRARIAFDFGSPDGKRTCHARVYLDQGSEGPKPASYAFDGHWVERTIGEGYRMAFESEGHRQGFSDPLEDLVRRFVEDLSSAAPPRVDPAAWPGTALVARIARAWPMPLGRTSGNCR